jgi:hypothetical protein
MSMFVKSWWLVILVEETRIHQENHRPVANHWQTWSHNVVYMSMFVNDLILNASVKTTEMFISEKILASSGSKIYFKIIH